MLVLRTLLVFLLCLVSYTGTEAQNFTERCPSKTKTLYLLGLAPFPDREYPDDRALRPGWIGGPTVIPAAQVAVAHLNSKCDILEEYRVELLLSDSGCNIVPKALVSIADGVLDSDAHNHEDRAVVGIIGPSCSTASIVIGDILTRPGFSMLHISPSATSPTLENTTRFRNTFRNIGSTLENIEVFFALIQLRNFQRIAIFYETARQFNTKAADELENRAASINVKVQSFGISESSLPVAEIENTYRVVFVFSGAVLTNRLVCLAYQRRMTYPNYQFFHSYRNRTDFDEDISFSFGGSTVNCTAEEMLTATNGSILAVNELIRQDDMILVSNVTADQYLQDYQEALREFMEEMNYTDDDLVNTQYQNSYYDAVWAMAVALNASIPRISSELNASLADYARFRPNMTEIVRSELLSVDFQGVRGTQRYNPATQGGEDVTVVNLFIVNNDSIELVGTYDPIGMDSTLNFSNENAFIPDKFVKSLVSTPIYVEAIVFLIVLVVLAVTVFFHVVNLRYNRVSTIRATTPALNNFIFLGCYLYAFSIMCISFNGVISDGYKTLSQLKCIGFIWCESIALTLIYGTICVKTWRLLRIFSHTSAKMMKHLQTYKLAIVIILMCLVDVVINLVWNAVDPWYLHSSREGRRDPLYFNVDCRCNYILIWLGLIIGWKAVLFIVVLYLAIATRRIHRKEYKQTKAINSLVYVFLIIYALTFPWYVIFVDSIQLGLVTLSYLSICLKNILCIVMCIFFVFLPPVLPHLSKRYRKTKFSTQIHRLSQLRRVSFHIPNPVSSHHSNNSE